SLQLEIYPVPAKDELYITGIDLSSIVSEISIYNLTGEKVVAVPASEVKDKTMKLDISSLATGMYWLQIQSKEKILRRKFLKIQLQPRYRERSFPFVSAPRNIYYFDSF